MTQERIITVQWQGDAGHAWLGVYANALAMVGLREVDLSHYSYFSGPHDMPEIYWLEEDCDAPFFLEFANKAGYELHFLPTRTAEGDSPIRSLPRMRGKSLLFEARFPKARPSVEIDYDLARD
jgi:hypothetical protein